MNNKFRVRPLNQTSILRSFALIFIISSIVPLCVLFYLYLQILYVGKVELSIPSLQISLSIVAIGSACGYFILRNIFNTFIKTTQSNRRLLAEILGQDVLPAREGETNEVELLAQTFQHIKQRLEMDNEHLKKMANTDSMTGLYNHRYFMTILDYEVNRIRRYGGMLCLLMIDVDQFKAYNDTFGHLEGDKLIKEISGIFKGYLRSVDIPCRYGGDEFAILLPQTDIGGARRVAEKIKTHVEALTLTRPVTISVGGCKWQEMLSAQDFLVRADQNLYKAKDSGRNIIIIE